MQAMKKTNATKLKKKDAYYETLPHHLVPRVINYSRNDNDITIQHSTSSKSSKFKAQSFSAHAPNCTMQLYLSMFELIFKFYVEEIKDFIITIKTKTFTIHNLLKLLNDLQNPNEQ